MSFLKRNPIRPADRNSPPFKPWWQLALAAWYTFLTKSDQVEPADLIFVLAGRMERKHYGVELYKANVAPRLLLSVGRFEVSRMNQLDLHEVEVLKKLRSLRDNTPPNDRNFFLHWEGTGIHFEKAELLRASTYGEAFALRKLSNRVRLRKVLVVSTDVHLRRVALTFETLFRSRAIEFRYCPVPARLSFIAKQDWWVLGSNWKFILKESAKLIAYWLILFLPESISRRLMTVCF